MKKILYLLLVIVMVVIITGCQADTDKILVGSGLIESTKTPSKQTYTPAPSPTEVSTATTEWGELAENGSLQTIGDLQYSIPDDPRYIWRYVDAEIEDIPDYRMYMVEEVDSGKIVDLTISRKEKTEDFHEFTREDLSNLLGLKVEGIDKFVEVSVDRSHRIGDNYNAWLLMYTIDTNIYADFNTLQMLEYNNQIYSFESSLTLYNKLRPEVTYSEKGSELMSEILDSIVYLNSL